MTIRIVDNSSVAGKMLTNIAEGNAVILDGHPHIIVRHLNENNTELFNLAECKIKYYTPTKVVFPVDLEISIIRKS